MAVPHCARRAKACGSRIGAFAAAIDGVASVMQTESAHPIASIVDFVLVIKVPASGRFPNTPTHESRRLILREQGVGVGESEQRNQKRTQTARRHGVSPWHNLEQQASFSARRNSAANDDHFKIGKNPARKSQRDEVKLISRFGIGGRE